MKDEDKNQQKLKAKILVAHLHACGQLGSKKYKIFADHWGAVQEKRLN
jgi:hypothetical protein